MKRGKEVSHVDVSEKHSRPKKQRNAVVLRARSRPRVAEEQQRDEQGWSGARTGEDQRNGVRKRGETGLNMRAPVTILHTLTFIPS